MTGSVNLINGTWLGRSLVLGKTSNCCSVEWPCYLIVFRIVTFISTHLCCSQALCSGQWLMQTRYGPKYSELLTLAV